MALTYVATLVGFPYRFADRQKGQEIAKLQISTNAHVIFHAAGKTGIGVIKAIAASPKGSYAIGTDRNQVCDPPCRVLTILGKRGYPAVFESVDASVKGTTSLVCITRASYEKLLDPTYFTATTDTHRYS